MRTNLICDAVLLGPCRTGPGSPVLRKVRSITGSRAGQPVPRELQQTECVLFPVQFVDGGAAGSVIYGPYDFNPGSRRVHNALSCRSYPQQAAPLLLWAFHFCPFFCLLISSPPLSMPLPHSDSSYLFTKPTIFFSAVDHPLVPGGFPQASILLFLLISDIYANSYLSVETV